MGYQGFSKDGRGFFLFSVGATFQYRAGPLVAGALFETGPFETGPSCTGTAALVGLGTRPSRDVRYELLAAVGYHSYPSIGSTQVGGSTAYAGGRAAIIGVHGTKLGHFEFGVYGDFQDDLSRMRVPYSDASGTGVLGTWRLGFGVEIGGTYDIY